MMLATTTTTTAATTATTVRTDSKTNKKPTLRGNRSKQKKALSRRNAVAGLNSERLSNNEYPIGEVVLGIELRTHGAKGALIDTANADFMRPGVEVDLEELKEEAVEEALSKIATHYNWGGTVGVSYTRAVMRVCGNRDINKHLVKMFPRSKGKVGSMIHTEAAAYAQMYYGPGRDVDGVVLVVTIGKGFGTVVYNHGQKVRNMNMTNFTWTYEGELKKLQQKYNWQGIAPVFQDDKDEEEKQKILQCIDDFGLQGSWEMSFDDVEKCDIEPKTKEVLEEFLAWGKLVDEYLQKVTLHVKPERVILLTTGHASTLPTNLLFKLFAPAIGSAGMNPTDALLISESPSCIVKGAALGAKLELSNKATVEILRAAICKDITGAPEPRILTDEDMQFVFKRLDRNKDGQLDAEDILRGAALFEVVLSEVEANTVLRSFAGTSAARNHTASFDDFERWWIKTVKKSVVKHVQNQEELETHLNEKTSANENPLIVLQCGYSYCRPCIKFEHSYESVAKDPRFKNVKFLKVVGDASPALSHLTHELEVENTPDFRIFRGDKVVQRFTGANRKRLEDNIIAVLEGKDVKEIPGIIIK
jgi:thiol-disulfide isomerase/thioredoxin